MGQNVPKKPPRCPKRPPRRPQEGPSGTQDAPKRGTQGGFKRWFSTHCSCYYQGHGRFGGLAMGGFPEGISTDFYFLRRLKRCFSTNHSCYYQGNRRFSGLARGGSHNESGYISRQGPNRTPRRTSGERFATPNPSRVNRCKLFVAIRALQRGGSTRVLHAIYREFDTSQYT